jgi:hypothetical protein
MYMMDFFTSFTEWGVTIKTVECWLFIGKACALVEDTTSFSVLVRDNVMHL